MRSCIFVQYVIKVIFFLSIVVKLQNTFETLSCLPFTERFELHLIKELSASRFLLNMSHFYILHRVIINSSNVLWYQLALAKAWPPTFHPILFNSFVKLCFDPLIPFEKWQSHVLCLFIKSLAMEVAIKLYKFVFVWMLYDVSKVCHVEKLPLSCFTNAFSPRSHCYSKPIGCWLINKGMSSI